MFNYNESINSVEAFFKISLHAKKKNQQKNKPSLKWFYNEADCCPLCCFIECNSHHVSKRKFGQLRESVNLWIRSNEGKSLKGKIKVFVIVIFS